MSSFEKKLEKAGGKEPDTASLNPSPTTSSTESNLLSLLEKTFFTPFLNLLKIYLHASNGNNKTDANCIADFRTKHPFWFKSFFTGDLICRFLYAAIVLLVVVRGLGIVEFIKSWISK